MPQPVRYGELHFLIGPGVLNERQPHAVHISKIACQWAMIDGELATILSYLTDTNAHLALSMYHAIGSLSARVDTLKAAARSRMPNDLAREFESTLVPKIRKGAGSRATVLHAVWAVCDDYPDALIQVVNTTNTADLSQRSMVWSLRDLREVLDRLHSLYNEVQDFQSRVHDAVRGRGEFPEQHPQPHSDQAAG